MILLKRLAVRGRHGRGAAGPRSGPAVVLMSLVLVVLVSLVAEAQAFGLEDVSARAAKLANSSYQKGGAGLPGDVKGLELRPASRHPVPARAGAVAEYEAALRDHVLPSAAGCTRTSSRSTRSRPEGDPGRQVRSRDVRLRQEQARRRGPASAGLRRLPRALPGQHADLQGRGAGLPGRQLLPGARSGPAVRSVGARPRHRHRGEHGRGVPAVRRVLDRATVGAGEGADHLWPARLAPSGGGLPVRGKAGRDDRARCRRPGLPPQERRQAGAGAADQHVLVRRQPAGASGRLSSAGPRLRRPVDPDGDRVDLAARW